MMMRRLAQAACLAVLTLAFAGFEAAGQRRIGLPRPRQNEPARPSPTTTAPAPTPAPSESPAPTAAQTAAATQTYKPAIEYQSFLQLRFYENQGGFLVEDLQVVFPPPRGQKATFVVARANGQVVTTVPLRLEAPLDTFTAFGRFVPDGVPGNARVGEPGDYVLSVQIDGQPITTLPFQMKREASNDPFNPTTTFVREGPWRDLAHFSHRPDVPDSHLEFSWWTSLRELPPGSPQRSLVTVHILHGGQEIAATRSPVVVTQTDWQLFQQEFHFPEEKKVRWMTLADLTRRDGEYTVVAKVNGKPFKSYKAQVRGGQLQRHPRNSLDTQPHTAFISPRLVDTSRRVSTYAMRDTYWITRN
jgi:hypothetical protein